MKAKHDEKMKKLASEDRSTNIHTKIELAKKMIDAYKTENKQMFAQQNRLQAEV